MNNCTICLLYSTYFHIYWIGRSVAPKPVLKLLRPCMKFLKIFRKIWDDKLCNARLLPYHTGNYLLLILNLNNKDILEGSNCLYTLLVIYLFHWNSFNLPIFRYSVCNYSICNHTYLDKHANWGIITEQWVWCTHIGAQNMSFNHINDKRA